MSAATMTFDTPAREPGRDLRRARDGAGGRGQPDPVGHPRRRAAIASGCLLRDLAFYGIGWAVSAAMYRSRALWGLAFRSFVAAPVLAAFTGYDEQYLAYAAALFLLMALPGFLLMRGAKG